MSKRIEGILEDVLIIDITEDGKGLGKSDGQVVFVEKTVPGDLVDVQLRRKKKSVLEGSIAAFKTYSEHRAAPFCPHFGICGGCKWQHLSYASQLLFKAKQVKDSLERLGKLDVSTMQPIMASAEQVFYRNKLEYTFSGKRWLSLEEVESGLQVTEPGLGFHIPGRFDKILDIDTCFLQADPSNQIRNGVREYAKEHNLEFFNLITQEGFLRNLIIRLSSTEELMVIVVFARDQPEEIISLLNFLDEQFPSITSLQYIINTKKNDTIYDQDVILYRGRDHIFEKMEELNFKISAKSFYQTNSAQAYNLYKKVRDYADLQGTELVYDLYTGTGTIANFIAAKAAKVIGMEYVEDAVKDAFENSKHNGITNTDFFAGDIKDLLSPSFVRKHGRPDVVITDPPRAGMHADVVEALRNLGAEKLIYVSCNAATQARDMQLLSAEYEIVSIQPVDMFPHTQHVENIIYARRRK